MIFSLISPVFASEENAEYQGIKRKFLVSAYYSPLKGQEHYIRGSYEADIRLNGRGTNGADGTEVFAGMLAAPKNYAFGTQIYIPSLGVGTVHDRGGAIIARNEYDRIDVWMGHGEEGLARALAWGMRTVEGVILDDGSNTLDYLAVQPANITHLKSNFSSGLKVGSKGDSVNNLQDSLRDLGFFQRENTGYFGEETESALLAFQLENGVISSANDAGAGYFGPKTRSTLSGIMRERQEKILAAKRAHERLFPIGMEKGSESEDVRRLQIALRDMGYLDIAEATGKYGQQTIEAVQNFQIENGVISSIYDGGAGRFGPKTHKTFMAKMNERRKKIEEFTPEVKMAHFEGEEKQIFAQNPAKSEQTPDSKMMVFEG